MIDYGILGLSFLEGMGLILSPCILPILPLILVTGIQGGRLRPYGIIVGFIMAFTAFTLFAREVLGTLNIDPHLLQDLSIYLILAFGVILFSDTLSEKFSALTQRFASFGQNLSTKAETVLPNGFWSGLILGAGIALVWTPCAGPIMAAVLVQTLQQSADTQALLILTAFSIGVGVPMLLITLFSKQIIGQVRSLSKHSEIVRKVLASVIIVTMLFTKFNVWQRLFLLGGPEMAEKQFMPATQLLKGLDRPYTAPKLAGISKWINTGPLNIEELTKSGKVVLIDFWTYSCINCVRTIPYIKNWHNKYHDKGLVIIGVHAPEFEFEKDAENVQKAVKEYGIEYAVAIDSDLATWKNFDNHYWPAHYMISKDGKVVYTHHGEGDYDVTENNIRYLLGLGTTKDFMKPEKPAPSPISQLQSPETYLGERRTGNFASPEVMEAGIIKTYTYPKELKLNEWALKGSWVVEDERSIAKERGAALEYHFRGKQVYLVMASDVPDKLITAKILLNGKPISAGTGKDVKDGEVVVRNSTLYELVNLEELGTGVIEIQTDAPGLAVYAFTFGSK